MRVFYMLLICELMMVFIVEGCSPPVSERTHRNANVISKEIDDIIGIDIIATPKLGGRIVPLTFPEGAKDAVVIGSVEAVKDESDLSLATSELSKMVTKPSNTALDLVTRIWLRIRLKDRGYARYCMYDPNGTYFFFAIKGPVDMKSWKDKKEWIDEGISVKSNKKFREVINRHIPKNWMSPYM